MRKELRQNERADTLCSTSQFSGKLDCVISSCSSWSNCLCKERKNVRISLPCCLHWGLKVIFNPLGRCTRLPPGSLVEGVPPQPREGVLCCKNRLMLNYRPNWRRRLGRPSKRLLHEAERGL